MTGSFSTEIYKKILGDTLRTVCVDRASGKTGNFEKLFFPLKIDEGKYAFQKYSQQMLQARKDRKKVPLSTVEIKSQNTQLQRALAARLGNLMPSLTVPRIPGKTREEWNIESNSLLAKGIQGKIDSQLADLQLNIAMENGDSTQDVRQEEKPQSATIPVADTPEKTAQGGFAALLMEEPEETISPGALIIQSPFHKSRVVAVASAGHGKTTLLKRLALYCCQEARVDAAVDIQRYGLTYDYDRIPCLVYLRNITDSNYCIQKAVCDGIFSLCSGDFTANGSASVLYESYVEPETGELDREKLLADITEWVEENEKRFLLLLDGLDELPDQMRLHFLTELEAYLEKAPQTHVVVTSRVAGLSEKGVKQKLSDLQFRGRSIMPLTDTEAQAYAEKWLKETQPEDMVQQLLNAVSQILTERRFIYLKEFMRTPLDLLVILKQVASNTLSLNRYRMFRDMMWELFTNHEKKYNRKRSVFEDTMAILGFVAYHMQMNESLYITMTELRNLTGGLQRLSFQTELLRDKSVESVVELLNTLAANVGIIEKDDRAQEVGFTFPIRAHQEFLTAYACCHLKLDANQSRTNPTGIISSHLGDSRWLSVINFALSDLYTTNNREFELLIHEVFKKVKDLEQLQTIVESDLPISREHAKVLCENAFRTTRLSEQQRKLLMTCMHTQSGPVYNYALRTSFLNCQSGECPYLEAYALTAVMWGLDSGHSPYETAVKSLSAGTRNSAKLGAKIISLLATSCMEEDPLPEFKKQAKADLMITKELVGMLKEGALQYRDAQFVITLVDLWVSKQNDYPAVKTCFDQELYTVVTEAISKESETIRRLCVAGANVTQDSRYQEVVELFTALGTLPLLPGWIGRWSMDLYAGTFLCAMYERAKEDSKLDQIAFAVCCLYYSWDLGEFLEAWTVDICKGVQSHLTRMESYNTREQNHFSHMRWNMGPLEANYWKTKQQAINAFQKSKSPMELFREGDLIGAANACIAALDVPETTVKNHLAFLLRYGKLDSKLLDGGQEYDIPELLSEQLSLKNPFACCNMMLYQVEQGNYEEARRWIDKISSEGWHLITDEFWKTELWDRKQDPEGALVCMLAVHYGGCRFDAYQQMLESVCMHNPALVKLL